MYSKNSQQKNYPKKERTSNNKAEKAESSNSSAGHNQKATSSKKEKTPKFGARGNHSLSSPNEKNKSPRNVNAAGSRDEVGNKDKFPRNVNATGPRDEVGHKDKSPKNENATSPREQVDHLLQEQKYKDAALLIIEHKLQKFYPFEKILVPLYLKQIQNLIFEYLINQPDLQRKYARYLDQNMNKFNKIYQDLGMKNVCPYPTHVNCVKKHLSKVIVKYGIPISSCPNLLHERRFSTLHFFIKKKYKDHSITEESWQEMIDIICTPRPSIDSILISKVVRFGDLEFALQWAIKHNFQRQRWPTLLKKYSSENRHIPVFKIPPDDQEYLKLALPMSKVHLVETPAQLLQALQVMKLSTILGIDEEWQPFLGLTDEEPPLALIQMATRTEVYLLDIIALKDSVTRKHWKQLADIYTTSHILKLTFGFDTSDLDMLKKCSPLFSLMGEPSNLLDLKDFSEQLRYCYPKLLKEENSKKAGLSKFAAEVLGLPLDKKEQQSNWEKRPLRPSLLTYAALDAYCLIQIYDALEQRAKELNLDFDEIVNKSLSGELEVPVDAAKKEKDNGAEGGNELEEQPEDGNEVDQAEGGSEND